MSQVIVRCKVKREHAARNEARVRQVYDELHQTAPASLADATFVLEDGVSSIHIASTDKEDGRSSLPEVAAFQAFQERLGDRGDEPPASVELRSRWVSSVLGE